MKSLHLPLWRMYLQDDTGSKCIIPAKADRILSAMSAAPNGGQTLTLIWSSTPNRPLAITTIFRVQPGDPLVYMRIDVQNESALTLTRVDFPVIGGIGPFSEDPRSDQVIWPRTTGRLISNPYETGMPTGYWEEYPYPSASQSMQFTGIYGRRGGLYLAAYDPSCSLKRLQFDKTASKTSMNFHVRHFPQDIGRPGNGFAMTYDAVLTGFGDSWWEAAGLYRGWAVQQPWCRRSSLLDDPHVSPKFKTIAAWLTLWGSPETMERVAVKAHDFFQLPLGGHWYSWHALPPSEKLFPDPKTRNVAREKALIKEDDCNLAIPEYFPAKPGFAETIERLQRQDIRVMPYINTRIWDASMASFTAQPAVEAAIKKADGQIAFEEYTAVPRPFAVMCAGSPFWQNTMADITRTLIQRYHTAGVYLDQLSATGAIFCHDASHPHKPGGGTYWVDGYWRMLDIIRNQNQGQDYFLTSESFTESYVSRVEGFLPWISYGPGIIPLAQAVYGGKTVFWGRHFEREDFATGGVCSKFADMLTSGVQLGWISHWMLDPKYAREMSFVRDLARLYDRALREPFLDGQFIEPPVLMDNPAPVKAAWIMTGGSQAQVTLPPVLVAAWKMNDNTHRLLMINPFEKEASFRLDLPRWKHLPASATAGKARFWFTPDCRPEGPSPASQETLTFHLKPRQACVLELETIAH